MSARLSGLHLQLLGLVFLPFSLILIAVALLAVGVHEDAMRRLVSERDERAARAAADALSQNLEHLTSAVQSLAQRAGDGAQPQEIVRTSDRLLGDFDAGVAFVDRQGELLASTEPQPAWLSQIKFPRQASSPAWIAEVSLDDGSVIILATAMWPEFTVIGGSTLRNLGTAAMLTSMAASESSSVFLVDSSGNLLHHVGRRPAGSDLASHPGVSEALAGESGSTFRSTEGAEHVVAFAPLAPASWALIVEEPWREVTSPVLSLSLLAPLALVPALLATLIGLWFGATKVIRPLRELQAQAERMALADTGFEAGNGGGIAEIQALQDALNRMTRRISSTQQALHRYVGAVTNAQEEERNRLARELHDETIQGLIAIDHQIQMLIMESEDVEPELRNELGQLHEQVNRAIQELRRMTKALRPTYLEDLGLVPALRMLADEVSGDSGIAITVEIDGDPQRLERDAELAVYRILQEALNNMARHSEASMGELSIRFAQDRFQAVLRDDGRGFEFSDQIDERAAPDHFGLMGMVERAELVGAKLNIQSQPDQGTRIQVSVDLSREAASVADTSDARQTA